MDTSPEYIKMCATAREIQGGKNLDCAAHQNGDFFWDKEEKSIYVEGTSADWWPERENIIWLPRQDQLQKMLIERFSEYAEDHAQILFLLADSVRLDSQSESCYKGNTLEQLTLESVMGMKYGKKWNGEEWVPT